MSESQIAGAPASTPPVAPLPASTPENFAAAPSPPAVDSAPAPPAPQTPQPVAPAPSPPAADSAPVPPAPQTPQPAAPAAPQTVQPATTPQAAPAPADSQATPPPVDSAPAAPAPQAAQPVASPPPAAPAPPPAPASPAPHQGAAQIGELHHVLAPHLGAIRAAAPNPFDMQDLWSRVENFVNDYLTRAALSLAPPDHQALITGLVSTLQAANPPGMPPPVPPAMPPPASVLPTGVALPGSVYPSASGGQPHTAPNGQAHADIFGSSQKSDFSASEARGESSRRSRIRQARVTSARGGSRLSTTNISELNEVKAQVQPALIERIDVTAASKLGRDQISKQIGSILQEILQEKKIQLNRNEQSDLIKILLDDMLGLGPLEPLLDDEKITDIMVNGPNQVYVEKGGRLELTPVNFNNNQHVMNIASRIVTAVGRRVDETMPLADARLIDGSRVNIIIPPLAIDGPSISIRKFSAKKITLEMMAQQQNLSPAMETVLKIAGRSRLNILISGGTGSGKTTLLNAISQMIDSGERIVSIEDAAELQLQQPHVVRLETRPPNLEGENEITMRDLLKNSLRMRPDRIILGEVRGEEAVDMLQAMNTGHDGSLGTIHANRPREALSRLENMIGLSNVSLPARAVRTQIASALDMIVQVSRMRDGKRRITSIMEIVGMEGEVVTTQELFTFKFKGEDKDGNLYGEYAASGLRPHFATKAAYFGLEDELMRAVAAPSHAAGLGAQT